MSGCIGPVGSTGVTGPIGVTGSNMVPQIVYKEIPTTIENIPRLVDICDWLEIITRIDQLVGCGLYSIVAELVEKSKQTETWKILPNSYQEISKYDLSLALSILQRCAPDIQEQKIYWLWEGIQLRRPEHLRNYAQIMKSVNELGKAFIGRFIQPYTLIDRVDPIQLMEMGYLTPDQVSAFLRAYLNNLPDTKYLEKASHIISIFPDLGANVANWIPFRGGVNYDSDDNLRETIQVHPKMEKDLIQFLKPIPNLDLTQLLKIAKCNHWLIVQVYISTILGQSPLENLIDNN